MYDFIEDNFYFSCEEQVVLKNSPLHSHNLFELYYLTKGSCQYFVDDHAYQMQTGDVLLIPNDVPHRVVYDQKPHSRIVINFDRSCIQDVLRSFLPSMVYIERVPRVQKMIETILQKIKVEYERPDVFSKDCIRCYVGELLLTLARAQNAKLKIATDNNFVEQATAYIRQNYMNKITLGEVAKFCAVSVEHLSRTFKKKTGMGFSEYLTLYRLKCAEEMLFYYPDLSISEIAYKCGFNDGNYFSVVYKRRYGISPSKLNRVDRSRNPQSDPDMAISFDLPTQQT